MTVWLMIMWISAINTTQPTVQVIPFKTYIACTWAEKKIKEQDEFVKIVCVPRTSLYNAGYKQVQ